MSMVSNFRSCIAETIQKNTLNESNWGRENWKNPWHFINQDVLNDAFNQHGIIEEIFSGIGEIIPRKCKSMLRIEKKITEQPLGRENYFKVVSDLVAVRIHCNVDQIPQKIDHIQQIVLEHQGVMHVRGSSEERPYGFSMGANKKYTDITQYIYVFLEKVGYPIEFQIGHEFASHTFTIDSAIRDNPSCGKVDLWSKDFYGDVKSYILAKANHETPKVSTSDIQTKAKDIHNNKVQEDLQKILDNLYTEIH